MVQPWLLEARQDRVARATCGAKAGFSEAAYAQLPSGCSGISDKIIWRSKPSIQKLPTVSFDIFAGTKHLCRGQLRMCSLKLQTLG